MKKGLVKYSMEMLIGCFIAVFALNLLSYYADQLKAKQFLLSPYEPLTNLKLKREGGEITGEFKIRKIRDCEFGGSPPAYIRWANGAGKIGTGEALIKVGDGTWRKLQPRTVIPVGETRTVGPIKMPIPEKFKDEPEAWAQLAVVCDRGDGQQRTFFIEPLVLVKGDFIQF